MRTSIIQTVILTLIGLSVTSCQISEQTPKPELDLTEEQETQDNVRPDTSIAESDGAIDSGMEDATSCEGDLCDQQCEVDEDCQISSSLIFYCDLGEGRCKEGCYEGSCDGDLVCNLDRRICNDYPCISIADCNEGQYCDPENLICRTR